MLVPRATVLSLDCLTLKCITDMLRQRDGVITSITSRVRLLDHYPTVCIAIAGELNGLSVADNHAPAAAAPAAGIADLFGSEPASRPAPALPTVLTAGVQPPNITPQC